MAVEGLEFFTSVAEGDDLSGTYKGPVLGIEKQVNPFPCVVINRHISNFIVDDGLALEGGGNLINLNGGGGVLDRWNSIILAIVIFMVMIVSGIVATCFRKNKN